MEMDRPLFEKGIETAGAAPTEVSFGPFRLLRTQFLLLEGDKPVSTSSLRTSTGSLGSPPSALVAVAAALDSILTAFALAPASA